MAKHQPKDIFVLDKMHVTNMHTKKNHITWEDMVIERDLKHIRRYGSSTGKKNHIKWENVVRGRDQVSKQKYKDHVV